MGRHISRLSDGVTSIVGDFNHEAAVAIKHTQTLCNCVLTPNEALKVYSIAKQEPPQWLLDNAKVKTL